MSAASPSSPTPTDPRIAPSQSEGRKNVSGKEESAKCWKSKLLLDLLERLGLENSCDDATSVERKTRIDRSFLL